MKMSFKPVFLAVVPLLVITLLLSGCVTFASPPTASQNQVIGSVRISFTVCASNGATGACSDKGNSKTNAVSDPAQVFLGFRIPAGSGAPQSFISSATGPSNSGPQLQFTKNGIYAGELQRLDPAPTGEEWVGYTSQWGGYTSGSGEQNFSADVDFALPTHADGSPYSGPFTYQVVVGGRQYFGTNTPDANEPIDCLDSLTSLNGGAGDKYRWTCVDDPSAADLDTDSTLETRDAGITPGVATPVEAGSTATVPFTFAYAGQAVPAASFSFQAQTSVPGASATPSLTTLAPATDSSAPVNVSVTVPEGAPSGTYSVTLTAKLSDAVPVVAPAMTSSKPPAISGIRRQGKILFASPGRWTKHPASYGYQWQRCKRSTGGCGNITQAIHHWYKLRRADVGTRVRVLVSVKNGSESARMVSAISGPVKPALASPAQITRALNRVPVPRGLAPAKIGRLLRNGGFSLWFGSPGAGQLTIVWYLKDMSGAASKKRVVVASLKARFAKAERRRVKIALTARGRALLAGSDMVTLACRISFAQTERMTFSRTGRLVLVK
jgi:hypothetical protein